MERIKEKWDTKYPNRNNVSTQNLRDNTVRFQLEMVDQNRNTYNSMQLKLITNG